MQIKPAAAWLKASRRSSSSTRYALALASLILSFGAAYAQKAPTAPPPPLTPLAPTVNGVWIDDTGDGAIEIAPCGDSICGRIVWLRSPMDKAGRPLTDGYNPESANRKRPICGLPVIGDLKLQKSGAWDAGWIYDPKEGKSYDVELKLRSADRLQVLGYIGTKFLSETFIWTRAPANLPRCVITPNPAAQL